MSEKEKNLVSTESTEKTNDINAKTKKTAEPKEKTGAKPVKKTGAKPVKKPAAKPVKKVVPKSEEKTAAKTSEIAEEKVKKPASKKRVKPAQEEKSVENTVAEKTEKVRTKEDIAAERAKRAKERQEKEANSGEDSFLKELSEMREQKEEKKDSVIKKVKKHQIRKKLLIAVVALIVVLGGTYGAGVAYFGNHFMFRTTVNGQNVAFKTVQEVEDAFATEVESYTLKLKERGGTTESLQGKDFAIAYEAGDSIDQIMKKQKPTAWIGSLFSSNNVTTPLEVSYDKKQLKTAVKALECMDKEKMEAPENAYPSYDGEKYVIEKEKLGTTIKGKLLLAAVEEAVTGLQESLDLSEADVYKKPEYTSESKKVKKAADKMNTFLSAKITYTVHNSDDTITVDKKKIVKWIKTSDSVKISFDKEAIGSFVEKLAEKCNSTGEKMKFKTASGKTIKISGYDFGYRVDQDDEYAKLVSDIKSGKEVTREPEYASRGDEGIGDTYAEVDLTNQMMYFYKDGKQVLASDVVTGNPSKGNATPPGLFKLAYKQKDKVLRGEKQEDGTYEYESPVSYWMPFNGGIGFHDATWQTAFGGTRYKTYGSHGCVNMPLENAKTLYNLIEPGTPVVCYK